MLLGADSLGANLLGADSLGANLLGADSLGANLLGADASELPLQTAWTLWRLHIDKYAVSASNWQVDKLNTVRTVPELCMLLNAWRAAGSLPEGNLFLMREGIRPEWNDPANSAGGVYTYRLARADALRTWREIVALVCGETLLRVDDNDANPSQLSAYNGVAISCYGRCSLLQIWTRRNMGATLDYKDATELPPAMQHEPRWTPHAAKQASDTDPSAK
jgi:hypothetical protein